MRLKKLHSRSRRPAAEQNLLDRSIIVAARKHLLNRESDYVIDGVVMNPGKLKTMWAHRAGAGPNDLAAVIGRSHAMLRYAAKLERLC